ncbi:MAG: response regulator transcription factor [Bacteroidaceae bacterium]|nr:response regulator transcription factor [Bacteroidaceae bacterium]
MEHILVIEDDRRLAMLLRTGIEEAGYQVLLSYDAEMALRLVQGGNAIDLVVSDIILPGMSGLELCKRLRQDCPGIPVIMLTALGTTDDKLEGFDAGADDYMTKPFDFRELIARIGALLKRASAHTDGTVHQPKVLKVADLVLEKDRHECSRAGNAIKLTPKEFSLLQYLMENAGRVVSRVDIQERVWNTHFDTGTNFIDVYINYLRRKVDKDFNVKLIRTVPGVGFMLAHE